jgi:hypothetical protein
MVTTVATESLTGLVPRSISPTTPLPDTARSMDAAKFQQLLSQAQEQQANVEFSNPATSAAAPGMNGVLRGIASSSDDFMGSVDKGLKSLSKVDLSDPNSIGAVIQNLTVAQLQSVQMTAVLGEVASSKRSLQTLFQNQG